MPRVGMARKQIGPGLCCVGSTCEPSDLGSCNQIGGNWTPPPEPEDDGWCFATRVIRDYLGDDLHDDAIAVLLSGGTYALLKDARDVILRRWRFGLTALRLYRKHGAEVVRLTRRDRELRRQVLVAFLRLAAFSRVLLRYGAQAGAGSYAKVRYTLSLHKELLSVTYRLDASGASKGLTSSLRSLLETAEEFVDLPLPAFFRKAGIPVK